MLETHIQELTAAVLALTKAIGGMQAPAPVEKHEVRSAAPEEKEVPNEQSKSTSDTSQTSAEESKPALTYVDHVKPITLRLSKEKGRDTAIAVLGRFGVKGAQDLDAGQWGDYIAHCEKVLAGGEV